MICIFSPFFYNPLVDSNMVGYSSGWRGGFAKPVGCRKAPRGFESLIHRHSLDNSENIKDKSSKTIIF